MANRQQLAHIWAQQTEQRGKASNLYFEGTTIYSYGTHFPIARFVEHKGRRAVLFTTRTYSSSTSAHIYAARGALHGLDVPVFNVEHPRDTPKTTDKAQYESRIKELSEKAIRSRLYGDQIMSNAQEIANEANQFAEFFGFKWRLPVPELSQELRDKIATQIQANKARNAAKAKKQAQLLAIEVAKWRKGESASLYQYTGATMLRVNGDKVQTSRGAEVPANHARRIWHIIQRVVRTGQAYQRNGHTEHVGQFAVDAIETDGTMRAGCHTIPFSELQQCAIALGVA